MNHKVRITKEVRAACGQMPISRQALVRLFAHLYYDLGHHADAYWSNRLPNDSAVFRYPHTLRDGGRFFTATFLVSDVLEPNALWVFDVGWYWGS